MLITHIPAGYIASRLLYLVMALLLVCNAALAQGEQLARSRQCFVCHDMTSRKVGPSFSDISHRYRFDKQALNVVTERILEGSSGSWGVVPMPPNLALGQEEARQLAAWVLEQRPQEVPVAKKQMPKVYASQELPAMLHSFLRRNARFRLINENDVDVGLKELFASGELRPFIVEDTNKDGIEDVVAVLRKGDLYYVVALHGMRTGIAPMARWIVRGDDAVISGVHGGPYVLPRYCYCLGCCANPFYRWSGSSYELFLQEPGEEVCLDTKTPVYSRPSSASAPMHTTQGGAEARILAQGPRQSQDRWYKVALRGAKGGTGYVEGKRIVRGPGDCE